MLRRTLLLVELLHVIVDLVYHVLLLDQVLVLLDAHLALAFDCFHLRFEGLFDVGETLQGTTRHLLNTFATFGRAYLLALVLHRLLRLYG